MSLVGMIAHDAIAQTGEENDRGYLGRNCRIIDSNSAICNSDSAGNHKEKEATTRIRMTGMRQLTLVLGGYSLALRENSNRL